MMLAFLSAIAFPAYGGTWLARGRGPEYTYYGGQPGNRGEVIPVEVKEIKEHVYEAKLNGQRLKGQWLGYHHPSYGTDEVRWCYFTENGKEAKNWLQIDGNWYNFGGGCTMLTGWHRTDGNYYYFDPVTGIMQTSGTAVRDGITYSFGPDGLSEKTDGLLNAEPGGSNGWIEENGKHYYLRDGQRVTNEWLQDGNDRYYVGADGAAYTRGNIIDGCFYMFTGEGRLMMNGGHTFHNGIKYVFDGTGKGVPAEMTAEERLLHSASTLWCWKTYEVYARDVQMFFWEGKHQEQVQAGLAAEWGILSSEECLAMISHLFETGKASPDKSEKAWNFSRAMMLCESGMKAGWWNSEEQINRQIVMAPAIQQSFSSWEEFHSSYMEGFTKWNGTETETYEKRKDAYDKYQQFGSMYEIDWNIPIEKTW